MVKETVGGQFFDDVPPVEDHDAFTDLTDDAEIMRDQDQRHACLALDLPQKLKDLRLNSDIQGGGRFISDQDVGLPCKRHGDHNALVLAAG
ncbi:hypothetical protein ACVWYH_001851 [Bradyrhizobium sp. GM24.11]